MHIKIYTYLLRLCNNVNHHLWFRITYSLTYIIKKYVFIRIKLIIGLKYNRYLYIFLIFIDILIMADNLVDPPKSNETNQPAVDEWKIDGNETSNNVSSNNDNNKQNLVEKLNDITINDNAVAENQESNNCNFSNNENVDNTWADNFESKKKPYSNKNKSGNRRGRGGYHKSNNNNYSFDSNLNNFQNNGLVRGRGRGRGLIKKFQEENEWFGDGFNAIHNNHDNNITQGHHDRGRRQNRGRGGRFKERLNDNGNNEDGHKKKENNKPTGSKTEYIPPDIENEESVAGIEAGLNFDKYDTIEVKVSGDNPPKRLTSFHSSGLNDILLDNLAICNFSTPTPIQNYAIPIVIAGRDLMASAQTGSGKTVS